MVGESKMNEDEVDNRPDVSRRDGTKTEVSEKNSVRGAAPMSVTADGGDHSRVFAQASGTMNIHHAKAGSSSGIIILAVAGIVIVALVGVLIWGTVLHRDVSRSNAGAPISEPSQTTVAVTSSPGSAGVIQTSAMTNIVTTVQAVPSPTVSSVIPKGSGVGRRCRPTGPAPYEYLGFTVNPCMSAEGRSVVYWVEVAALERPVKSSVTYWLSEYVGKPDKPVSYDSVCTFDLRPGQRYVCAEKSHVATKGKVYFVGADNNSDHLGYRGGAWPWLGTEFGEQYVD